MSAIFLSFATREVSTKIDFGRILLFSNQLSISKQAKGVRYYQGCTNSSWCNVWIYIIWITIAQSCPVPSHNSLSNEKSLELQGPLPLLLCADKHSRLHMQLPDQQISLTGILSPPACNCLTGIPPLNHLTGAPPLPAYNCLTGNSHLPARRCLTTCHMIHAPNWYPTHSLVANA